MMNSIDIIGFKKKLKDYKCKIMIIKNSLFKKATRNMKDKNLNNELNGPNILLLSNNIIKVSREIMRFEEEEKCIFIKRAIFENKNVSKKEIIDISKIKNETEIKIKVIRIIKNILLKLIFITIKPAKILINIIKKIKRCKK